MGTKAKPNPLAKPEYGPITGFIKEMTRYPALFLCTCFFIITIIAVIATIQFRNDMRMGAIREPTGSIFWAALTVALFLSYARQKKRAETE